MPVPIDPVKLRGALQELGIDQNELQAIQRLPLEFAQKRFAEVKERVNKTYRNLAKKYHPDQNGGDPAKTERFKLLGTVKDEFDKLQIRPPSPPMPRPVPMPVQQIRVVWSSAGPAYNNATTNVPGSVSVGPRGVRICVPWRVATMRPQ
jgi:hypothetical protein